MTEKEQERFHEGWCIGVEDSIYKLGLQLKQLDESDVHKAYKEGLGLAIHVLECFLAIHKVEET